jgi:hypothetical protein
MHGGAWVRGTKHQRYQRLRVAAITSEISIPDFFGPIAACQNVIQGVILQVRDSSDATSSHIDPHFREARL